MKSKSDAYKEAGVDINAGYEAVKRIKPLVDLTKTEGTLSPIGGFGGLFKLNLKDIKEPVLVSGTDGVGTKLKIAFELDYHESIGIDCVAMCVNDIVCSGAKPLIFLDYIACGKNNPLKIASIVKGVAAGCFEAGASLVGGETAEMPGFYPEDEYDLAGFSVGLVDQKKIIDGSKIKDGDNLIGLASSGIHSNGFSLIRKIIKDHHISLSDKPEILGGKSIGKCLIEPTVIYVKPILDLIECGLTPKAISHITGGGFFENIPRMLPEGFEAIVNTRSFPKPPIFKWLEQEAQLSRDELYSTFNMGIGMVLAVNPEKTVSMLNRLQDINQKAYVIGRITEGDRGVVLK